MLRRKTPANFWQSVTGSLEWHENPLQAAQRELCEETGLSMNHLHDCNQSHMFEIYSFWRYRYKPGVTQNREHVFQCQLEAQVDITLDAAEHEEYRWMTKAEAVALASSPTNSEAIREWVPDPE